MKKYSDVQKIIWITRSFSTSMDKELLINRSLSKIFFLGRTFELLNQIFGITQISLNELYDKGLFCNLEPELVNLIIDVLINFGLAQKSSDEKYLELNFLDNKYKLYSKIYQESNFKELSKQETCCLKILDILTIKPLNYEEIADHFLIEDKELLKSSLNLLTDLNLSNKIEIKGQYYYLTPLNTYGNYQKYVDYCQNHSSEEIDLVAELFEYLKEHKGIPYGLLPEKFKKIGKYCLDLGILHGVNYEFGKSKGDDNFTLIFPTSEEFDMIKHSCNDFDKIHASIGLLVYGVYYNPHKIKYPEKYISALISRGELRGTNIFLKEKISQFNPSICSGIINYSPGFSKYFTSYGNLKTFEVHKPKLISSEDNRNALNQGLRLFLKNDPLEFETNKLFEKSIFDIDILYSDTAGISTFPFSRKKSLKEKYIEELFQLRKER